jgi:hypothetical protein
MDKRLLLAKAIETKRQTNGIHYECLVCTLSDVEQRKAEIIKAHPLYDCRFFIILRWADTNG